MGTRLSAKLRIGYGAALIALGLSGCFYWGDDWEGDPPFPGTWSWSTNNPAEVTFEADGTARVEHWPMATSPQECGKTATDFYDGTATWSHYGSDAYTLTVDGQEFPFTYGRQAGFPDWESIWFGLCKPVDSSQSGIEFYGNPAFSYYED